MEETLARIYVLLMLAMFVVAFTLGSGPVFWVLTAALLATFAAWGAWIYAHRNDLPEGES